MRVSDGLSFDLRVAYPGFTLEACAEIPAQGITVLSGPSGSGKTTLLRALAGLETRAEGSVRLGPLDWSNLRPAKRGIGYVFQETRLFPHLDVAGNLDYGARRRSTTPAQMNRIIEALDLGTLLPRDPAHLSGGEARRVALGRALAAQPLVLLLDEPLAGLDRARKADLMPYIVRAVAEVDGPTLYVTHSRFEISGLADQILSIHQGRLTGWTGAAPRLVARVSKVETGRIELAIGDAVVWVAGQGQVDERRTIALGEDYVLSRHWPGKSSAALTLESQVIQARADDLRLNVAGQELRLASSAGKAMHARPNDTLWLTIPRIEGSVFGPLESDD